MTKFIKFKNVPIKRICNVCKNERIITNKRLFLCQSCNNKTDEKWLSRQLATKHKKEIFHLFNYHCVDCKSKKKLEMHHLEYVLDWENLKKNILLVCRNCHLKRHKTKTL